MTMDTVAKETYLEFLQDGLDEVGKGWLVVLHRIPNVLGEDGDGLGIGLRFKLVPKLKLGSGRDGGKGVHTLVFAKRGVVHQNS